MVALNDGRDRSAMWFLVALAFAMCVALVVAAGALARVDRFGGGSFGGEYLPYQAGPYLPYTEDHAMPPEAHPLGVHPVAEVPGAVAPHGGRALLSEKDPVGKTVLLVRGDTLYQLTHR